MKENTYCVYILSSANGTLYIGITNDIERRMFEHKSKLIDGFTKKYDLKKLIYFQILTCKRNIARWLGFLEIGEGLTWRARSGY